MTDVSANQPTPISLITQANDVMYSLLEKRKFERVALPLDPNLLSFSTKPLNERYKELLFTNRNGGFAPDLLNSLICFYFFISLYFILTVSAVCIYLTAGQISGVQVVVQIAPFALLIGLYCSAWHLMKKRRTWLFRLRPVLCTLNALLVIYLLVTDKRMLSNLFETDELDMFGNHTFMVMLVLVMSIPATMYHFQSSLILGGTALATVLSIQVSLQTSSGIALLEECGVLAALIVLLCFISYQHEFRSRQVFYQTHREKQAHTRKLNKPETSLSEEMVKSEVENAVMICDKLRKTVKNSADAIIYNEIRSQLREAVGMVENLREKIIRGVFVEQGQVEIKSVDKEDEKFIRENFVEEERISSGNTVLSKVTLSDIPVSAGLAEGVMESIHSSLNGIGRDWGFDIWQVYEQTSKSVTLVGAFLSSQWEFSANYHIQESALQKCLAKIEAGYIDNPFHNGCHAADVCHSLMYFYNHSSVIKKITGLDMVASLLAALGHDLGHPGVTNRFLVSTEHELAVTYNDVSVLENMHISALYHILKTPDSDFLQFISLSDRAVMRKLIIAMVLETDMSRHFTSVGRFRTISTRPGLDCNLTRDKVLCLSFALKCADAGYSAKPLDLHTKWSMRAMEELFSQGDLERRQGLAVSTYFDRDSTDVPKSQAAYLRVVCIPMYEAWTSFLKSEEITHRCKFQVTRNLEYWESRASGCRSVTPDKPRYPTLSRFYSTAHQPDDVNVVHFA